MPNLCIGDAGYTAGESIRAAAVRQAALIRQTAAITIAVDNGQQMVSNYRKQRDIADRTLQIMERQQNQLETVFWPREEQFLNEFSNPEMLETIEVMSRRYGGRLIAGVSAAFALRMRELKCEMPRYCSSANSKVLQDIMLARSVAIASARALGRDIAFAEYQARHDTNYERRLQAVALGRNLMNQAVTLYESAGRSLAAAGNYLSGQFNNALMSFGYARGQYQQANERLDELGQRGGRTPTATRMPNVMNPQGNWPSNDQSAFGQNETARTLEGDTSQLSKIGERNPTWDHAQSEKWNEGDIGNRDLIRSGVMTYPVIGLSAGVVVVKMADFMLTYADHLTEGETTY
jgi:hypothetical protein